MNIIKIEDDWVLIKAEEEKLKNFSASKNLPFIDVKYTLDEISQLADALNIHWTKILTKYLKEGASGSEHIQKLNRKEILEDVINQAIDYYNLVHINVKKANFIGNLGITAILLMVEDVPFEDVPVYWPGEDDPILLAIFKWRIKIKK